MSVSDEGLDQGQLSQIQNELSADIPESWVLTTLGDSFKWGSGGTPRSGNAQFYGGDIPWLVIGDLNDGVVHDSTTKITELGLKNSSAKLVEAGSILLAMYGSIGKLGIAGKPLATNQAIAFTKTNEIAPLYLFFFLKYVSNRLASLGKGATQLNISQTVIKAFPFVLAPRSEQHRIVAKIEELFSELDKGIENLKTARAQLKVYRQALLKHAFEGNLTVQWRAENQDKLETADALLKRIQQERAQRYQQQLADWQTNGGSKPKAPKSQPPLTAEELAELPELPEGWGWVKLGDLAAKITDGEHFKPQVKTEGVYFLSAKDVKHDGVSFDDPLFIDDETAEKARSRCDPERNDILIVSRGATVGRMCIVNTDECFCLLGSVILVKATAAVQSRYFLSALKSPLVNKRIVGVSGATAQQAIYLRDIQHVPVPVCPSLEQSQIIDELEAKLSEVDQLELTITTSLQQAEALRQSILKKAFSGQLVPQDPHDEPASALLARIKTERAEIGNNAANQRRIKKVSA